MSKKPRLGNDPFTFIQDSRNDSPKKTTEQADNQPVETEPISNPDNVVQLDQNNAFQEMIEAIYLELGRVAHGVSDLKDSSLSTAMEKVTGEINQKISEELTSLTGMLQAKEAQLKELQDSLAKSEQQKQVDLETLRQKQAEAAKQLQAKEAQLKELQDSLAKSEQQKQVDLETLRQKQAEAAKQLQAKEAQLKELQEILRREQQEHQAEKEKQLVAKEEYLDQIASEKAELTELRETISKLKQAHREEIGKLQSEQQQVALRLQAEKADVAKKLEQEKAEAIKQVDLIKNDERYQNRIEHYKSLVAFRDSEITKLSKEKQATKEEIENLKEANQQFSSLLKFRDSEISNLSKEKQAVAELTDRLREERERLVQKNKAAEVEISTLQEKNDQISTELMSRDSELNYMRKEKQAIEEVVEKLLQERTGQLKTQAIKETKLEALQEEKQHTEELLTFRDAENRQMIHNLNENTRDIEKLTGFINDLEKGITTILNSNRWKAALALWQAQGKVTFRKPASMPEDFIAKTLQQYEKWRLNSSKKNIKG